METIVTKSYQGAQTRLLLPKVKDVAGVIGDNNSTKICFKIPKNYASGWQKYIEFDCYVIRDGVKIIPSYPLDEYDSFVVPYEITESSFGKEVAYCLKLVSNDGSVIEKSELATLYFRDSCNGTTTEPEPYSDIVSLLYNNAFCNVTYTDPTDGAEQPQLTFIPLNPSGEPESVSLNIPYLDAQGHIPPRFIDKEIVIEVNKISIPNELTTLVDAQIPDLALLSEGDSSEPYYMDLYMLVGSDPTDIDNWYLIHTSNPVFTSIQTTDLTATNGEITEFSSENITAESISATSIEGTFSGDLTGNVTGDLVGNVTGDVTGDLSGNASTATTLQTPRNINGTAFNGSSDITTSKWGAARSVTIEDNDSTHSQTTSNVDGSGNITLKLPATIKAGLEGNATTASTADNYNTTQGGIKDALDSKLESVKINGTPLAITNKAVDIGVTPSNPTLAWGQESTIGTIAGQTFKVTMPANPDTDVKVTQNLESGNYNLPLLLSQYQNNDTTIERTGISYRNNSIYANPSTGTVHAIAFDGAIGSTTNNVGTDLKPIKIVDGVPTPAANDLVDTVSNQPIGGVKTFTATETKVNEVFTFTNTTNPRAVFKSGNNTFYIQASESKVGIGPGWDYSTKWDTSGNMTVPGTATFNSSINVKNANTQIRFYNANDLDSADGMTVQLLGYDTKAAGSSPANRLFVQFDGYRRGTSAQTEAHWYIKNKTDKYVDFNIIMRDDNTYQAMLIGNTGTSQRVYNPANVYDLVTIGMLNDTNNVLVFKGAKYTEGNFYWRDPTNARNDTFSARTWMSPQLRMIDKNGAENARIQVMYDTTGKHELHLCAADSAGNEKYIEISSAGFATAPARAYEDGSTNQNISDILTKWHLEQAITIGGTKTFSASPITTDSGYIIKNTAIAYTDVPSSNGGIDAYRVLDKNGIWYSIFGVERYTDGRVQAKMQVKGVSGNNCRINLVKASNDIEYATAPFRPYASTISTSGASDILTRAHVADMMSANVSNQQISLTSSRGTAVDSFTLNQMSSKNIVLPAGSTQYQNVSVTFSAQSPADFADYPYMASYSVTGLTADMYATVTFSEAQVSSGQYAPFCQTVAGAVRLYAKSDVGTQTIPTISVGMDDSSAQASMSNYMALTGDQTADGVKTFTSRVYGADPASGATDKTLVTANWVSQTGNSAPNNLVHRSGEETIVNRKTFTAPINGRFNKVMSTNASNWTLLYKRTATRQQWFVGFSGHSMIIANVQSNSKINTRVISNNDRQYPQPIFKIATDSNGVTTVWGNPRYTAAINWQIISNMLYSTEYSDGYEIVATNGTMPAVGDTTSYDNTATYTAVTDSTDFEYIR